MRWLYQEYGVAPYQADGWAVVPNYRGTRLININNDGTHGLPGPGDVLSYGDSSTGGHTSIVTAVTGSQVTVIEQNAVSSGTENLTVTNGVIQYSPAVNNWLHDPYLATVDGSSNVNAFEWAGGTGFSAPSGAAAGSQSKLAVSGSYVGYVSNGTFYIYDEGSGTTYTEWGATTPQAIAIGGNYIGVLENGVLHAKQGLTGSWVTEAGAAAIAISSNYIVIMDGSGNVSAKTGGLYGTWVSEVSSASSITASTAYIGWIKNGYGYAITSINGSINTICGPSATSFDVSANNLACIDSSGLRDKNGGVGAAWVNEPLGGSGSAVSVAAGDQGLAYRDSNGYGWGMLGYNTGTWYQEMGSGGYAITIDKH
jgi:hypothetical protein